VSIRRTTEDSPVDVARSQTGEIVAHLQSIAAQIGGRSFAAGVDKKTAPQILRHLSRHPSARHSTRDISVLGDKEEFRQVQECPPILSVGTWFKSGHLITDAYIGLAGT